MKDNAVEKIRTLFEDLLHDKKSLVKVLSVVMILLMALVLRIHAANKADITVKAADTEADTAAEEYDAESYSDSQTLYVDIGGAVVIPGVYQVSEGTRLYQVIEMAGGITEEADTDAVNRASFVEDGQKVIIPVKGSPEAAAQAENLNTGASDIRLININTASKEELTTLNGIGDVIAERIIEYRSSSSFKNKEDIMSVKGIGSGTYDKIKDDITC